MTVLKIALAAAGVIAAVSAIPAAAVVTTFATYSAPTTAANIYFVNSGNSVHRTSDATFFTTATAKSKTPGSVLVRFSFLQNAFVSQPAVQNVSASFTLSGTVAKGSPATLSSGSFTQAGVSGSFSFLTTSAITVTGPNFIPHTYAAGSNLLSATFSGADITGGGSSGASSASTSGHDTVTFSSDFLDFTPTIERDLGLTFTSVAPTFKAATGVNKALQSFRANSSGQFSSDPAPIINGLAVVPEPGVWLMMIAGFGLVGVSTRRRARIVAA